MRVPVLLRPSFILIAVMALSLASCATIPPPGERVVMVVKSFPQKRQQLQVKPGLSRAIEHGLSRDAVKAERVMIAGCAIKRTDSKLLKHRHGYVLLPEGVKLKNYTVINVAIEEADSTEGPYMRFFGHYLGKATTTEADFIPDQYSTGDKAFLCDSVDSEGRTRVRAFFPVMWWDYDFSVAEASRNRQISDDDLRDGRVAIAECSPGVDSWAIWKVRIPEQLQVKVGDYIEAVTGVSEGYKTGALSTAIRKVAKPPQDDFIYTHGSYTVGCTAHIKPLNE